MGLFSKMNENNGNAQVNILNKLEEHRDYHAKETKLLYIILAITR